MANRGSGDTSTALRRGLGPGADTTWDGGRNEKKRVGRGSARAGVFSHHQQQRAARIASFLLGAADLLNLSGLHAVGPGGERWPAAHARHAIAPSTPIPGQAPLIGRRSFCSWPGALGAGASAGHHGLSWKQGRPLWAPRSL